MADAVNDHRQRLAEDLEQTLEACGAWCQGGALGAGPNTASGSTAPRRATTGVTPGLRAARRAFSRAIASAFARSVLARIRRSAIAAWRTASG